MDNDINTLAKRRHEMDAALVQLFSHTKDYVAKNINNKVLIFVNHIESELNTTKKELAVAQTEIERLRKAGLDTWSELRQRIHVKDAEIAAFKKNTILSEQPNDIANSNCRTPRTDAAVNAGGHQLLNVAEESRLLEKELAAFKKNNEELIQRHNAAISSWDEERERALREADRVLEWKEKYEDLEKYIRFIGKQIPVNTGGTFENDPVDAILDAAVRSLNDRKPKRSCELLENGKTTNEPLNT